MKKMADPETKKFIRREENFTCENCRSQVIGSGYTNHCPTCLVSKHVDINPGDRQEQCGGSMEPAYVLKKGDRWRIIHHCQTCDALRICDASPKDNSKVIRDLSQRPIPNDVIKSLGK